MFLYSGILLPTGMNFLFRWQLTNGAINYNICPPNMYRNTGLLVIIYCKLGVLMSHCIIGKIYFVYIVIFSLPVIWS